MEHIIDEKISRMFECVALFAQSNADLSDTEDQIYRLKRECEPMEAEATQEMLMQMMGQRSNEETRKAKVQELLAANEAYQQLRTQMNSLERQKMRLSAERETAELELKTLRGFLAFAGTVNERETAEIQADTARVEARRMAQAPADVYQDAASIQARA